MRRDAPRHTDQTAGGSAGWRPPEGVVVDGTWVPWERAQEALDGSPAGACCAPCAQGTTSCGEDTQTLEGGASAAPWPAGAVRLPPGVEWTPGMVWGGREVPAPPLSDAAPRALALNPDPSGGGGPVGGSGPSLLDCEDGLMAQVTPDQLRAADRVPLRDDTPLPLTAIQSGWRHGRLLSIDFDALGPRGCTAPGMSASSADDYLELTSSPVVVGSWLVFGVHYRSTLESECVLATGSSAHLEDALLGLYLPDVLTDPRLYVLSRAGGDTEGTLLFDPERCVLYWPHIGTTKGDPESGGWSMVTDGALVWAQYTSNNYDETAGMEDTYQVYAVDKGTMGATCEFVIEGASDMRKGASFYQSVTLAREKVAFALYNLADGDTVGGVLTPAHTRLVKLHASEGCPVTRYDLLRDELASHSPTLVAGPDGRYVLVATDRYLYVFDQDAHRTAPLLKLLLPHGHKHTATPVVTSAGGSPLLILLSEHGELALFDLSSPLAGADPADLLREVSVSFDGYGDALWPRFRADNCGSGRPGGSGVCR